MNVQEISTASIAPSPHNPRIFRDGDPELASLAESIRSLGVLSPILIRPIPMSRRPVAGQAFELIAGERRWRATKLAGLETIPAIVREDLSEHEAIELTVTENLQREDLHPLEEAKGVASLLGDGHDYRAVADRLGKSLGWVARRARLTKLSETSRILATDPESAPSRWPAAALELVARLEPDAQDAFWREHDWLTQEEDGEVVGVAEIARLLGDWTRELRLAPWKVDDETLDPQAGACSSCPKRSSCHPGLFDDDEVSTKKGDPADRCLDAVCWDRKLERSLERTADELESKFGTVVFAGGGGFREEPPSFVKKRGANVVDHLWSGTAAKKGVDGAVPVLHVTGQNRGKWEWRVFGKGDSPKARKAAAGGEKKVTPLAERRKKLEARRQAHALEAICEAVEKAETIGLEDLVALAAAFGTEHRMDRPGDYYGGGESRSPVSVLASKDPAHRLEKSIVRVIARRWRTSLKWHGLQGIAKIQGEISAVTRMLDIDTAPLAAAAAEAIPEPKSWAKLAEAEKAAKAKKRKAAKPSSKKESAKPKAKKKAGEAA